MLSRLVQPAIVGLLASSWFSSAVEAVPSDWALDFPSNPFGSISGNFVELQSTNGFPSGSQPRTVSFWAWVNEQSQNDGGADVGIVSWGSNQCDSSEFEIGSNNYGGLTFFSTACSYFETQANPSSYDTWTHVALTYDGNNLLIYVNGVHSQRDAGFQGQLFDQLNFAYFGRRSNGPSDISFEGFLNEIRIWTRPLTQLEVQQDMTDCAPAQPDVAGWWPIKPTSNGQVLDQSGNGNHGIINGAVSVIATGLHNQCGGGSGAFGDPQFVGFNSQSFQVHGSADTVYNVISSPSVQYNAYFRYLPSGSCRKGTECFAHPGNYFGSVGISVRDEQDAVHRFIVESGSVADGLRLIYNNQTLPVSAEPIQIGIYSIAHSNQFEVVLESEEFNIKVSNSDMFLNQQVSIGFALMNKISQYKSAVKNGDSARVDELLETLPHGILGQTWNTKTYNNRWKHIQGQLFDYVTDGVLGTDFKYNKF